MKIQDIKNQTALDLGFIGHKAEKLQELFQGYTEQPNEYGNYLRFENYSMLSCNQGVLVYTNIWTEDELKEEIFSKLLFKL